MRWVRAGAVAVDGHADQHDGRRCPRASGRTANMCKDPAMIATPAHEVAVLALPESMAVEVGLPHQFLGSATDADGRRLYRVRVASLDGGPVRTSAGFSVLPECDASILATARHRRRPRRVRDLGDDRRHAAGRRGRPAAADRGGARMVSICTGRVRARRRRAARRAAGHHALAARPGVRAAVPRRRPGPRRAVRRRRRRPHLRGQRGRASTCCCTWSAATTAPRWPTGSPGAASSPRGGRAASRSSSSGRCPNTATAARPPPAPGPSSGSRTR